MQQEMVQGVGFEPSRSGDVTRKAASFGFGMCLQLAVLLTLLDPVVLRTKKSKHTH